MMPVSSSSPPPFSVKMQCEPFTVCGVVVHGFGRGSRELGIPTANMDPMAVDEVRYRLKDRYGIYYGWAWFPPADSHHNIDGVDPLLLRRYPMVMSFGLNPHYNNKTPSVEPHLIHQFDSDFYDSRLCLSIEGYIRDEQKFSTLRELVDRIYADIAFAKEKLACTM